MPPRVLSEADKEGLSDEEIAALEEPEGEEEDPEGDEDDGDAGDGAPEDEPEDPPAKKDEGQDPPPAKPADPPAAAPDDVDVDQFRYKPEFTQVEAAALSKVEKDLKAAFEQFNAGDLSDDEYEAKRDELEKTARELDFKRRTDEREGGKLRDRYVKTWGDQLDVWVKQQGIDISKLDEATVQGFDAVLKEIETGPLGEGLKMRQQMDLARTIFDQRNPGKLPKPPKVPGKRPTKDVLIPPSLADLGSAEQGSAVEDGTFARLDRIMENHPERLEDELAKLSEERRDAWKQAR